MTTVETGEYFKERLEQRESDVMKEEEDVGRRKEALSSKSGRGSLCHFWLQTSQQWKEEGAF